MLLNAVKHGLNHIVDNLIKEGFDVNELDEQKNTPLHLARHLEVVQILINSGSNVNQTNNNNSTPLHLACLNENVNIITLLVENGADINAQDDNMHTPLFIACIHFNIDVIKLLISFKVNVNAQDIKKKTVLHYILTNPGRKENSDVLKLLLDAGCDPNLSDISNISPLFYACAFESRGLIEILLQYEANPSQFSKYGSYPIEWAIESNNCDAVELLLHYGADPNSMTIHKYSVPLVYASSYRYNPIVKKLLEYNCDINKGNDEGNTALHQACIVFDLELMEALIEYEADIYAKNLFGNMPFHIACASGNYEAVNVLASLGFYVNLLNDDNISPLEIAIQLNHDDVVKALIKNGCSFSGHRNGNIFITALHVAVSKFTIKSSRPYIIDKKIISIFIKAGLDLSQERHALEDYIGNLNPLILEDNAAFFDDIMTLCGQLLSLKYLCCFEAKKHIRRPLLKNINSLSIPYKIKNFLSFDFL